MRGGCVSSRLPKHSAQAEFCLLAPVVQSLSPGPGMLRAWPPSIRMALGPTMLRASADNVVCVRADVSPSISVDMHAESIADVTAPTSGKERHPKCLALRRGCTSIPVSVSTHCGGWANKRN